MCVCVLFVCVVVAGQCGVVWCGTQCGSGVRDNIVSAVCIYMCGGPGVAR